VRSDPERHRMTLVGTDGVRRELAPHVIGRITVEFRSATENDAESIALVHAESWQRTYRGLMPDEFLQTAIVVPNRLAAWRARMSENRPDRFTYVALDHDRVVGFICAFGNEDADWGSYIDNLHVAAGYQGRDIGAELMHSAGRWLCEHYPDCAVYLWAMEANASARSFYERLGGRNRETAMKSDPGGGRAPNCRYTWERPAMLVATTESRK
jgi:ribosomal protein S18 acetylase RimI-like enzyme